ncbi:MAG: hypothetical protein H0X39_08390 [Actinobacteria bacterium]|nr:hypothetical protein [Actinomycetota bacterium]
MRAERLPLIVALFAAALAVSGPARAALGPGEGGITLAETRGHVTLWRIQYRAHNGLPRLATLVLPRWYGPHLHPRLPLVISPHGRGLSGRDNAMLWGGLPAAGSFAVISPDGQGRLLGNYSWGSPGQIADLARMPQIAQSELPWLRIDRSRIYAFGGSMGGQETLLLLAHHPTLLAGAASFDAVADFALQYRDFPQIGCNAVCRRDLGEPLGSRLRSLARDEIGGSPVTRPLAFAQRSPITYTRSIAASCVPLQLWWSPADKVVIDQQRQSGKLFWRLRKTNPRAPISGYVGFWIHSREMRATSMLPYALAEFGLLHRAAPAEGLALHRVPAPHSACTARR